MKQAGTPLLDEQLAIRQRFHSPHHPQPCNYDLTIQLSEYGVFLRMSAHVALVSGLVNVLGDTQGCIAAGAK